MQNGIFNINHPHDSLFKKAFQNKRTLIDLLKNRLKPKILRKLDLETLRLENSSFISEKLKKSYSDLVFSVNSKKGKAYIYLLVEHQTKEGENMVLRLLEYNVQLCRQHVTQHNTDKLPVIINFVLYTGQKPYKGPKNIIDAFEDPILFTSLLKRDFVFELAKEDDQSLLKDQKAALAEFVLTYSAYRDFCRLLEQKPFMLQLIQESEYADSAVLYMLFHERHQAKEILRKLDNLEPQNKTNIMNALARIQHESKAEGIRLGEQRGIKLGEQNTLSKLVEKGLIDQHVAELMLKGK